MEASTIQNDEKSKKKPLPTLFSPLNSNFLTRIHDFHVLRGNRERQKETQGREGGTGHRRPRKQEEGAWEAKRNGREIRRRPNDPCQDFRRGSLAQVNGKENPSRETGARGQADRRAAGWQESKRSGRRADKRAGGQESRQADKRVATLHSVQFITRKAIRQTDPCVPKGRIVALAHCHFQATPLVIFGAAQDREDICAVRANGPSVLQPYPYPTSYSAAFSSTSPLYSQPRAARSFDGHHSLCGARQNGIQRCRTRCTPSTEASRYRAQADRSRQCGVRTYRAVPDRSAVRRQATTRQADAGESIANRPLSPSGISSDREQGVRRALPE